MRPFVFGKMRHHGDFVARGLTWDRQIALDAWLSRALMEARRKTDDFEARYCLAPAWRFHFQSDPLCGAGAIALSLDSVGRKYPLIAGLSHVTTDLAAASAEFCETTLCSAIECDWHVDRLADTLATIVPADQQDFAVGGEGWWVVDSEDTIVQRLEDPMPDELLYTMMRCTEAEETS